MQTLENAIITLKKNVKDAIPLCYWKKGSAYIFRIATGNEKGCSFYSVNGNEVEGTNPLYADLDEDNMIEL